MQVEKSDNFLIENAFNGGDLYLDPVDSHNFPVKVRGVNDGSEYDPNGKKIIREGKKDKKNRVEKNESGFLPLRMLNK